MALVGSTSVARARGECRSRVELRHLLRGAQTDSYAASTIRVEAGQPVVSTGAYAIVRHPLYSGALVLLTFTPLALGSYWTLLVLVPMVPVLAWRLLDEERFLKLNLPGYADYCRSVRFRLIPRIW